MNFLSHYYLDRERDNPWFFAGISTPDLVSVLNRQVRLKANHMPDINSGKVSAEQVEAYAAAGMLTIASAPVASR